MPYHYRHKLVKSFAYFIDFLGNIFFFWRRGRRPIDKKGIKKILVVKLDHLGDCFMATPIFEYLSNNLPQAQIDILCQESASPIFERNPYINKIIIFNYSRYRRGSGRGANFREIIKLIIGLKREKYDLFIDPRSDPFASLVGFLIRARYSVGFAKEEIGGFLYTHPLYYNHQSHETEKYRKILKNLDIDTPDWRPQIYLTEDEKVRVDELTKNNFSKKIIACHISSGLSHKMWPLENFGELIKKVQNIGGYYEFALLGSQYDKDLARQILDIIHINAVKDLTGRLTIRETYYFLTKTAIFIGNDSVLGRFACALNILTMGLMNVAVDKNQWGLLGQNAFAFWGFDKKHRCAVDRCNYPCPHMVAIKVEDVFNVVKKFLRL